MSDQNKCPNCGIDENALKKTIMDAMMISFTASMNDLRQEMNEMRRQHSAEINEMRRQHSAEINEMRREHSSEINEMRREHSAEIQELISDNFSNFAQSQEKLEESKRTHASELQAMRFAADSTTRVLRQDLENSNEVLRTANSDLTVQVENLTVQVTNLTVLVTALQTENASLRMAINRRGGIGA